MRLCYRLTVVNEQYVPGASVVRVKGVVGSVNAGAATATVSAVVIDYSAELSVNPALSLHAGSLVEFSGIQPTPGGPVLVAR